MYKDIEKKFNYYKEQVLNEFIKKGIYPDNALIAKKVKTIDMYLSVFSHYDVSPGKEFNAEEYNQSLKLVMKDLQFLYELLYELTFVEYNKLQDFIYSYLTELGNIVDTYKQRAEFENSSTTLGQTILFKNNSFKMAYENSTTSIELGELEITNGSTLACIANINNTKAEDVIFRFKRNEDEPLLISPYNYNNDILTMPGSLSVNKYKYKLTKGQIINGPLIMDIKAPIDYKNKYEILGGKNKIFVKTKDNNDFIIEEKPITIETLSFDKKSYINFYVVDGNAITFRFNKKPISTNFPMEEQTISNLNPIHHFFMECDEDFSFQFELDKGEVYAIKEAGIINENKLYYSGASTIEDFIVIEYGTGEKNKYNVTLDIFNSNDDIDIDSIIIKKLE